MPRPRRSVRRRLIGHHELHLTSWMIAQSASDGGRAAVPRSKLPS